MHFALKSEFKINNIPIIMFDYMMAIIFLRYYYDEIKEKKCVFGFYPHRFNFVVEYNH